MGAFGGLIQTNKGRNLQAKAEAGALLKFTRMGIGDGQLGGQSIPTLNKLISEKKSLPITRLKPQLPAQAIVGAVLSNQDVTTGFYFRELGIFAQDPDEGEILYAYGNAGSGAEYIPPAGTADIIEKTIDMIVTFGQAQNVSAVINSSLIFATPEDVAEALTESKAYTDQKFSEIVIQDASLTQKGVVKLNNAINSTSDVDASTPSAVKKAYDRADQAFQAGNERKAEVVAALVAIGVQASTSETWAQLIPKIAAVIRATGNATAADVLAGKTFSNASASGLSGTMIKRSGEHAAVDYLHYPSNNNLYIKPPVGFYKGGTKGNWDSDANVYINEPKLNPANIPKDTTIFGVLGVLERMTTAEKQAIANAITGKGVAASVNDTNTVLANKIGQIRTSPRKASGQTNASTSWYGITYTNGNPGNVYVVTVNGLDFTPRVIIISDGGYRILGYYSVDVGAFTQKIRRMTDDVTETLDYFISGNLYVNSSGFRLPAGPFSYVGGMNLYWYAYE